MHLVILGPQGSGKGTQANMLADKYGLAYFAMGDALRETARQDDDLGREVKTILDKGELVPAEITNRIMKRFIEENERWIVDGYPRNMEQAEFLDGVTDLDGVLVLEISDEEAVHRLAGRRQCPKGHSYHVTYKRPKEEGICDIDGLPLTQRSDDTEDAIRKRLEIYHESTKEVLDHYTEKVIQVDGEQAIPDVHKSIMAALKEHGLL